MSNINPLGTVSVKWEEIVVQSHSDLISGDHSSVLNVNQNTENMEQSSNFTMEGADLKPIRPHYNTIAETLDELFTVDNAVKGGKIAAPVGAALFAGYHALSEGAQNVADKTLDVLVVGGGVGLISTGIAAKSIYTLNEQIAEDETHKSSTEKHKKDFDEKLSSYYLATPEDKPKILDELRGFSYGVNEYHNADYNLRLHQKEKADAFFDVVTGSMSALFGMLKSYGLKALGGALGGLTTVISGSVAVYRGWRDYSSAQSSHHQIFNAKLETRGSFKSASVQNTEQKNMDSEFVKRISKDSIRHKQRVEDIAAAGLSGGAISILGGLATGVASLLTGGTVLGVAATTVFTGGLGLIAVGACFAAYSFFKGIGHNKQDAAALNIMSSKEKQNGINDAKQFFSKNPQALNERIQNIFIKTAIKMGQYQNSDFIENLKTNIDLKNNPAKFISEALRDASMPASPFQEIAKQVMINLESEDLCTTASVSEDKYLNTIQDRLTQKFSELRFAKQNPSYAVEALCERMAKKAEEGDTLVIMKFIGKTMGEDRAMQLKLLAESIPQLQGGEKDNAIISLKNSLVQHFLIHKP